MNKSSISFYGGVGSVTGANFLFTTSSRKNILVDCGLIQGDKVATEDNRRPWAYDVNSVNALFVTHAHLDHVGRIPKLIKDGYKGPIYSTPQTKALAEIILNDAVTILADEAKQNGTSPLFDVNDVGNSFLNWKTLNYHEIFNLDSSISVILKDAGHILGSSMIEFSEKLGDGKLQKILFTGDLGNSPAPLLPDTEKIGDIDYVVMESVYGDRNHEGKEGRSNKFEKIVKEAIGRGGALVIPTFSVDRTQVLLYELNNLVEKNKIPDIPIFVDSPMATKATAIYSENSHLFKESIRNQIKSGDDIFKFPRLKYTISATDSREIKETNGPKIILAGSGMSIGGRVISHERNYLSDPKSTILLVGYQTAGSLGRELAEGAKKVKIYRDTIKVKAKIETLYGYSAHRDSDHLLEFVTTANGLKKVFVVMGELKASMYLAQKINDEIGVKAVVPQINDVVELIW